MKRMKRILFVILILLLINISKCEVSERAKKIAERLIKLKKFHDSLKARKLQTDEPHTGEVIEPNRNKRSIIQVLLINSYSNFPSRLIKFRTYTFNAFLYFLNIFLPRRVFIPVKIRLGRLRTLEEEEREVKVETMCVPSAPPSERDAVGGISQRFNCTGDVETSINITGLNISSDDIVIAQREDGYNRSVPVYDINFSEEGARAAANIQNALDTNVEKVLVLQNGVIGPKNGDTFTINGDLFENDVKDGDTIILDLYDSSSNSDKKISCIVQRNSGDAVTLNCNTNGENIDADLDMKSGLDEKIKVFLNMTEGNRKIEIYGGNSTTSGNLYRYRVKSSGLSGGAIAGIVIACVVVLFAITLLIILLRRKRDKDEETIDNTAVVQLKSIENI